MSPASQQPPNPHLPSSDFCLAQELLSKLNGNAGELAIVCEALRLHTLPKLCDMYSADIDDIERALQLLSETVVQYEKRSEPDCPGPCFSPAEEGMILRELSLLTEGSIFSYDNQVYLVEGRSGTLFYRHILSGRTDCGVPTGISVSAYPAPLRKC